MMLETDHAIRALCYGLEFGQDWLPFGGIETARQVPIFAAPSARRELASKPPAHVRTILRISASRNDSVASECILSQVDKRVVHTPSRIVVAAVPVEISSQH